MLGPGDLAMLGPTTLHPAAQCSSPLTCLRASLQTKGAICRWLGSCRAISKDSAKQTLKAWLGPLRVSVEWSPGPPHRKRGRLCKAAAPKSNAVMHHTGTERKGIKFLTPHGDHNLVRSTTYMQINEWAWMCACFLRCKELMVSTLGFHRTHQ
jgi:hypothetical protein